MPHWRRFKDRAATATISAGGAGVLLAILLIFFYLVYEVLPLFSPATMTNAGAATLPAELSGTTLYLAIEEQAEIGFLVNSNGRAGFFDIQTGAGLQTLDMTRPDGSEVTVFSEESQESRLLGLGFSDG